MKSCFDLGKITDRDLFTTPAERECIAEFMTAASYVHAALYRKHCDPERCMKLAELHAMYAANVEGDE